MKNRVAIVTGGCTGVGRATVLALAEKGVKVVYCGRTTSPHPDTDLVKFCQADVSQEVDVKRLFDFAKQAFGPVTLLVNNAAILKIANFVDLTDSDWDEHLSVNVKGVAHCSKYAFQHMEENGGDIVNISSLSGIRGVEKFPGLSAYVASKFAVVGLTESLAVEGKPLNIRVNCLALGAVKTEMQKRVFKGYEASTLPEDIVGSILYFLDKKQSGPVTGSTLEVFCND